MPALSPGRARLAPLPQRTPKVALGGQNYLGPADFATLYDVNPLYAAGLKGAGVAIAIPGRSDLDLADVRAFRSYFGLPAKDPVIVHNGPAPGDLGGGEELEADLDVQWAGGVAPEATIDFVVSASTLTTDGLDLSSAYVVDQAVAPIVSVSFGACEELRSASALAFYDGLWAQAAAQGMTVVVAAGDTGAESCTGLGKLSVSALCSTPYDVCVGGTGLADTPAAAYWAPQSDPVTRGSALSYIPEVAWNEPGVGATGGGASAIYPKPFWQAAPGVPNDGRRDLPDLSLAAALHDGHLLFDGGLLYGVAGTSAAAPSLAGVLALVVQKAGGPQGNVNPTLYRLGDAQYARGGPAVFHDVTAGDNDVTPGVGFASGPGYDLATGLGSIDAAALAAAWGGPATPDFALALLSSGDLTRVPGQSATVAVQLDPIAGFAAPVALSVAGLPSGVTAAWSADTLSGAGSSTLTLATAPSVPTGWFRLDLTATGGGLTHSISVFLLLAYDTVPASVRFRIQPPNGLATALAAGPDGAEWATIQGVNGAGDRIGRVTPEGRLTETPLASCTAGQCLPYAITAGPDGALWFTEFSANAIGRITPAGELTEIPVPTPGAGPTKIVSAPDGALWFTEANARQIGRITPAGAITEIPLGLPYVHANTSLGGLTIGPDGNLWFTAYVFRGEFRTLLARMTLTGAVTWFSFASTFDPVPELGTGADGNLWFVDLTGGLGSFPLPGRPTFFHTVAPCRLLDTRLSAGAASGPPLAAGEVRDLGVGGRCGIPADAAAVAVNLTIVGPSSAGYLALSPGGAFATSTLNFGAGQVRTNNAILPLSSVGHTQARLAIPAGQANWVVDVTGYFR